MSAFLLSQQDHTHGRTGRTGRTRVGPSPRANSPLSTSLRNSYFTDGRTWPSSPSGVVSAWSSYWSPRGFKASGELADVVFAEPPGSSSSAIQVSNREEVEHRIAVVQRGGVPIVRLALAAQAAGAIAVVVVDSSGRCNGHFDQYCVLGADKTRGEFWAQVDLPRPWLDLRIPTVLVQKEEWEATRDGKPQQIPAADADDDAQEKLENSGHEEL